MSDPTNIPVPSGQPVILEEVIKGRPGQEDSWFFRFLAPELGPEVDYKELEPDLEALCKKVVLPMLGSGMRRAVISLADRAVPFGAPAPDAVQVFEAYTVSNGTCDWEPF